MTTHHPRFQGVWLPLVSPFRDGQLDEASVRRMVRHYAGRVDGFILAATTGEGFSLTRDETQCLTEWTREELEAAGKPTPVLLGVSSAVTSSVAASIRAADHGSHQGFLITCPYYVRPSQEGLRRHFEAIADITASDIMIYNIPYRAAVNMENETMLRLAERRNIIGVKDCCADASQSADLIRRRPPGFSVMTGEDAEYMTALRQGADGGVLASAHLDPEGFRALQGLAQDSRWDEAMRVWARLSIIPQLLFAEPNPAGLKHSLWRMGLIDSPELRLPMTPVSQILAERLDTLVSLRIAATAVNPRERSMGTGQDG